MGDKTKEREELKAKTRKITNLGYLATLLAFLVPGLLLIIFGRQAGGYIIGAFIGWLLISRFLLVRAIALDDRIHELDLVLDHIHASGCSHTGSMELIERQTHNDVLYGTGSTWSGPAIVTTTDFERMQCTECGSITVWPRGQSPHLELPNG